MKQVLALDISTKTGWAFFEDGKPVQWGTIFPDKTVKDFGEYPDNFVKCAEYLSKRVFEELDKLNAMWAICPESFDVVIEETNASRQNYSQKMLEYLHFCIVKILLERKVLAKYLRTGVWRTYSEANMSKQEKSLNAKIARLKKKTGKKLAKIDGKVVGKKTRKHSAIRRVEEIFGISMQRKEEDAADALLLGLGFIKGAPVCDGTTNGGKLKKKV